MSFSPPTGPRADKDRDAMDVDDLMEGKGKNRKYVIMLDSCVLGRFLTCLRRAPDSSARPLQQRKRNRF